MYVQTILYHFTPQISKCDLILYMQGTFTVIENALIMLGLAPSSCAFYLGDDRWSSAKYRTVIRELRCVINHVYTVNYISSEVIIPHDYKRGRGRLNPDVCILSFLQEPAEMNSRDEYCVTNA